MKGREVRKKSKRESAADSVRAKQMKTRRETRKQPALNERHRKQINGGRGRIRGEVRI